MTSAVSVALASPLLALSAAQHGEVSWITRPDVHDVRLLYHDYFGAAAATACCS